MNVHPPRPSPCELSLPSSRSQERGFTLIETSIALVVMMVVALSITSIFVYAINNNSGANDRELALGVAQQQMERLRNTPFNCAPAGVATFNNCNLPVANGGLAATGAAGFVQPDVTVAGRHYQITTVIEDLAFDGTPAALPTLKRFTVRVTPTNAGKQLGAVTLTTLRSTLIRGAN